MAQLDFPQPDGPVPLSRREFLGTTACALAAATFPSIIPSSALGRDGAVAPSNRITVGVIGCGVKKAVWRIKLAQLDFPQPDGPVPLSRREFLGTTACALAAATFPSIIPSSALGRDGAV